MWSVLVLGAGIAEAQEYARFQGGGIIGWCEGGSSCGRVGMAIGIGVGVAFGAGLYNMGLGIAIGVAPGPAFALGMKVADKKRHNEQATSDTRAPDR